MSTKIALKKDTVIVFMGSMNAMPMMYALELRKQGYDVIYFVDVPKGNTLSRPENHFPGIAFPYPGWIVELVLPSQILLPLFPSFFAKLYQWRVRRLTQKSIGCFVLNGLFASLAPYLTREAAKVGLSHGTDLDVWANTKGAETLATNFRRRSIFKFLPGRLAKRIIALVLQRQHRGYVQSQTVVYFPIGFNSGGDAVIRELTDLGVRYVPRYDISFEPLRDQPREFKKPSQTLEIFAGVRFLYRSFLEGNKGYSKGNDIIIRGIAEYFRTNPNIRVHFVEKGEDVEHARQLCRQVGLDKVVVWHKEMPFKSLLALYQTADICFDQVGEHWIGAIGAYALWLGKPLVANANPAIRSGVWPWDHPVCTASTSDEICSWLMRLSDSSFRKEVSEKSRAFVENYMSPRKALNEIFDFK